MLTRILTGASLSCTQCNSGVTVIPVVSPAEWATFLMELLIPFPPSGKFWARATGDTNKSVSGYNSQVEVKIIPET